MVLIDSSLLFLFGYERQACRPNTFGGHCICPDVFSKAKGNSTPPLPQNKDIQRSAGAAKVSSCLAPAANSTKIWSANLRADKHSFSYRYV